MTGTSTIMSSVNEICRNATYNPPTYNSACTIYQREILDETLELRDDIEWGVVSFFDFVLPSLSRFHGEDGPVSVMPLEPVFIFSFIAMTVSRIRR